MTRAGGTGSESPPSGIVTFLFTDIEGSTRLWEADDAAMARALVRHDEIVDRAIASYLGFRRTEQGEGDSVVAVFSRASDALACALDFQLTMSREDWGPSPIRVRAALHTGEAQLHDGGNYLGPTVNRAARLRSIAHGGQTLLSRATYDLVADQLPSGLSLKDLGAHRLKDLARPEQVYQVCHPDLPLEFPPLASLDSLPHNLPLQLTSFVGREAEMTEIRRMLSSARLLTLTGSGGCGKTRLVLQTAADLVDEFPDGVWWVDLAPITDPELVPNAVASALFVREVPLQPLIETVKHQLAHRRLLLVLDNCEQVVSGCAELAHALLTSCPSLVILATSREPLRVEGELGWRVPSLTLPEEHDQPDLETFVKYEAVRLFSDRAAQTRRDFKVTYDNSRAVAQICRRLDGIPLAIELAAGRAGILSPEQIATGLNDRFQLLRGGSRTALPRQQTLQASVDWSHHLLSEDEAALFRRLSVFAGSFNLEAAEQVCSSAPIAAHQILDLLSRLVDKSLVALEETGTDARYRLLETIRQYAWQKLSDSGENPSVRDRHLDYYLSLSEAAEPELEKAGLLSWAKRLEIEYDNLRAAMDWSERSTAPEKELRLASALRLFWTARGHPSECRSRLSTALVSQLDPGLRAKGLVAASHMSFFLADLGSARAFGEEALAIGRSSDDKRTIGRSLYSVGWAAIFTEPTAARPILDEGVQLCRSIGDAWFLTNALNGLGLLEILAGNPGDARPHLEEAIEVAIAAEDTFSPRFSHAWLALAATFEGKFPEAEDHLEKCLVTTFELRDEVQKAVAFAFAGFLEIFRGDYEKARRQLADSLTLARDVGNPLVAAASLVFLAYLEHSLGDSTKAAVHAQEALPFVQILDFKWGIALCLAILGDTAREQSGAEAARDHLEEAVSIAYNSGNSWATGICLLLQARLMQSEGDAQGAAGLRRDAVRLFIQAGEEPAVAEALDDLAMAAAADQPRVAALLLAATDRIRKDLGFPRFPPRRQTYEDVIARLRERLGPAEFQSVSSKGDAMSPDEVSSTETGNT